MATGETIPKQSAKQKKRIGIDRKLVALNHGHPRHRRRRGRAVHPQSDDHLLLPLPRTGGAGRPSLCARDADLPQCLRTATSNKQETIYCYSETERDAASAKLGGKPEITRFKGLGEISPAEFKQFIGKGASARARGGIRAQGGQPADPLLLHGGESRRAGGGLRRGADAFYGPKKSFSTVQR